jgi:sugar phosphate isomerase/epimerase
MSMQPRPIALFTDGLRQLSRVELFAWAAEHGIDQIELGTGGFSPAPHADLKDLASDRGVEQLLRDARNAGVSLAALNCSGNPLFPDEIDGGSADDRTLRQTLVAAAALGVQRVVCMSGCPVAGENDRIRPAFLPVEWLPQDHGRVAWQWRERVVPYWEALLEFASDRAPGVEICLELDPGQTVFTPRGFLRLHNTLGAVGGQLGVNLDPSHLFWQRMDPLQAIRMLGPLVRFAHAKDAVLDEQAAAANGVLEGDQHGVSTYADRSYRYATVGEGHGVEWWVAFSVALQEVGYDGPLSIEWEDTAIDPLDSIERAAVLLRNATSQAKQANHEA